METLSLKSFFHNGNECIGIYYPVNKNINNLINKNIGAKWSLSNKCWYIKYTKENYCLLLELLEGKMIIETDSFRDSTPHKYTSSKVENDPILSPQNFDRQSKHLKNDINNNVLSENNFEALKKFTQLLYLKAYSSSTIKTYRNEFIQLLRLLKNTAVETLNSEDLKRYMVYIMQTEKLSENTAHSRLNALKFYFEKVLGREKFFYEIPRPKKPLLLPKLLNENELKNLFNALENKKHKAMLFTCYSAGLRVSELANLKIRDIDSQRMQILIQRAKGKKDRYVNLSPVLLDILRSYIKSYIPTPKIYLFESAHTLDCYPARTIQQIFTNAKNKAGIQKNVGIHSLRHSFATHLLDKGTDIKYIKDILGHFDIKTTERYLHVSKQKLVNIISPLDDLFKKENIEW